MGKIVFSILITIAAAIIFAGVARSDDSGDFSIRAGIGYDFISQEYFYDSLRFDGGLDSVKLNLLKREYLDDKKGLVYFKYAPSEYGHSLAEIGWEQTPENFRAVGWGKLRTGNDTLALLAESRLEIKKRYDGPAEPGEDLGVFSGRLGVNVRLSDRIRAQATAYLEKVVFDSLDSYIYNYHRFGGKWDFSWFSANYDNVFGTLGFEKRTVPDSAFLDYNLLRGGLGYMGSFIGGRLSTEAALEFKNYAAPEDQNDYWYLTASMRQRQPVAGKVNILAKANLEYFNYKSSEFINDDYALAETDLLAEWTTGDLTFAVGPGFEIMSLESGFDDDNDYLEYRLNAEIDYYSYGQVMLLFENEIGRRSYPNQPEFYSDFTFERVSLIGNVAIWKALALDIIFSSEWQWHALDADDNRIYLLSSSLTFTF